MDDEHILNILHPWVTYRLYCKVTGSNPWLGCKNAGGWSTLWFNSYHRGVCDALNRPQNRTEEFLVHSLGTGSWCGKTITWKFVGVNMWSCINVKQCKG